MSSLPAARRLAMLAGTLAIAAAGLGLAGIPSAQASCAGPQLSLEQNGRSVPPTRLGQGAQETLVYRVASSRLLRIKGDNLTFDCQDTYSATQAGCGEPIPNPVEPIEPIRDAVLLLTQRDRTWTLAKVAARQDLTEDVEVILPADVQRGPAALSLVDSQTKSGTQLELIIT